MQINAGVWGMKRNLWKILLIAGLMILLPLCAQAAGKKNDRNACMLWAADAATAPKNVLKSMPADLIRAVSPASDGKFCLVIPGSWNADSLKLFFEDDSITINGRIIHSGDTVSLPLNEEIKFIPADKKARTLTVCQTGGVPVLWMTSESGSDDYIEAQKGNQEPGWLRYEEADGKIAYEGELTHIRSRGNSTFQYEKKAYQIKLARSASLSGMKKDRTWVLLANMLDRSGIRNEIGLDIARYCGVWSFVPSYQAVDVYLNHDYKGAYLLCEKVQVDPDRLAITDMEEAIEKLNPGLDFATLPVQGSATPKHGAKKFYAIPAEPEDITGGYLVKSEITKRYATERSGFVTAKGQAFIIQDPSWTSAAQTDYISSLFQHIENGIFSKDGIDPETGKHFTEMIDLTTLACRYVLAEVTDDYDGARGYFYKDSDSVDPMVYAGPIWDLDYTWGVRHGYYDPKILHIFSTTIPEYLWYPKLYKHEVFRKAAAEIYRTKFVPAQAILLGEETDPAGILHSLDDYAAEVRTSQLCDAARWPYEYVRKKFTFHNRKTGANFDQQIEYLREYITQRRLVLNRHFGIQ